jgi:hypothetical protein
MLAIGKPYNVLMIALKSCLRTSVSKRFMATVLDLVLHYWYNMKA